MNRARVVSAALVVSSLCAAIPVAAQTPTPAEGWVVLPVEEYRALRERAIPPAPPPPAPPVDATLTRVDYDLRVDGESITGRALLMIDVLATGWTRVQIPAGLMVRDARLDGQPVSLVEGPPPHVLLARPGPVRAHARHRDAAHRGGRHGVDRVSAVAVADHASGADDAEERCRSARSSGGFLADRAETAAESRWTATAGRTSR